MARAKPDMRRRALTLDTGRRTVDVSVDSAGHIRRIVRLDEAPKVTRAAGDDGPIGFTGHAALFNKRTWIGSKRWGFWEEIAPGAFTKTITEADVRFLHNHNVDLVLARNTADNLRLSEDDVGLAVDADMTPTSYARDLALSLAQGDVTQMSFAFDMIAYTWEEADDGEELIRITELALWDVSTVTYPAYIETDAALRMDLMAAARAGGFDAVDLDALARRLADPDPDVLAALRHLARGTTNTPGPAETTQEPPSGPPDSTRDDSPPAETTGTTTRANLRRTHIRAQMALLEKEK
jgi:hypothetical protein